MATDREVELFELVVQAFPDRLISVEPVDADSALRFTVDDITSHSIERNRIEPGQGSLGLLAWEVQFRVLQRLGGYTW
jgi:hypothetical protein